MEDKEIQIITKSDGSKEIVVNESKVNQRHSFSVKLAEEIGVSGALIYKEIKNISLYKLRENKEPWVFYSSQRLHEKFPYLTQKTIQRVLSKLVDNGYIVRAIKNKIKWDKTYSYSPKEYMFAWDKMSTDTGQSLQSGTPNDPTIPSHTTSHTLLGETEVSQKVSSSFRGQPKDQDQLRPERAVVSSSEETGQEVYASCSDDGEYTEPRAKSARKTVSEAQIKAVCVLFGKDEYLVIRKNKTQREAIKTLLEVHGIDKVKNAMVFFNEHCSDEMCPQVYHPYDLLHKWKALSVFKSKINT